MLHAGPEQEQPKGNGFVTIEQAEFLRQSDVVAEFKKQHPSAYADALQAAVGLKRALQAFEEAKVALQQIAAVQSIRVEDKSARVHLSDLLDSVERDCRNLLTASRESVESGEAQKSPTVSQARIKSKKR